MTEELAVQAADAILIVPNCIGSDGDGDLDNSSLSAFAAASLQMLTAFSPEKLFANAVAAVSSASSLPSSSSPYQPQRPRLFASSLASCVHVWGAQSPTIQALVSAECLHALQLIGISLKNGSFSINSSTQQRALLCARVLPQETMSAIEVIFSRTARDSRTNPSDPCSASEVNDTWSCVYQCICSAMENAEPNRLGPTLSSFSELLPQLARLGPCPSPSTVQSLGDALHKRLQQPDNADTVAAVLMCKTSLKHCVLPLPPGRCPFQLLCNVRTNSKSKPGTTYICTQVYSRSLVTGNDRAGIFAWALFSAMLKCCDGDTESDVQPPSCSPDAHACSVEHELQAFRHDHNLRISMRLIGDIMFADMYPRDCTIVDWHAVSTGSSGGAHKDFVAEAACHALLTMMDAAAWTYGVVLATDNETASAVNFEHSFWVKSTAYRFLLPR